MRSLRAATACLVLAGLLTAPAHAAHAAKDACTWTETPIPPADTWGTANVVAGTGTGHYAGAVRRVENGQFFMEMVLWTAGEPFGRTQPPPPGYRRPGPVDENGTGTVAVNAQSFDPSESGASFRYHGGHQGLGVYERLPVPDGFKQVNAESINERGDVLGTATADNRTEAVVWPGDGAPPVVLELSEGNYLLRAIDIDNDGSVLLHLAQGPHLWRAGGLTPLATPPGYRLTSASSLRGGIAVGYTRALDEVATHQGLLWSDPANPEFLKGAAFGDDINAGGQVLGRDAGFADAVWQRTTFVDAIPANGPASRVFDDGSILAERPGGYSVWRAACLGTT
ncbi:hypothetical protein [Amycolatopsis magusensis]|uniref:Extracellular repeat, HAF family n=2 Tax=Actinomycetes TaxID=1760 RepID=A0ABS4PTU0_9PSEU|nr:hypothetical protein [Amycolatopsis magusensis]MBP2182837.1 hypothetical protein [Amycolatopsis magusensis]